MLGLADGHEGSILLGFDTLFFLLFAQQLQAQQQLQQPKQQPKQQPMVSWCLLLYR